MPRLVSRADLARLFGISRPAVTKRCQGAWAPACAGDRVDLDHEVIRSAAAKKGVKIAAPDRAPTKPAKPAPRRDAAPTASVKLEIVEPPAPTKRRREPDPVPAQPEHSGTDDDLDALAEAVRELVARFGTSRAFRDWLLGLKDIEVILGKRLANSEARGLVIPREFVKTHVFGAIEGSNRRLLADTPKTLCREIYALARTGAPLEEAEQKARKLLGKQLEGVKANAVKAIRNAGNSTADSGRPELARGAVRVPDERDDSDDPVGVG